jgi:hypothetical protein
MPKEEFEDGAGFGTAIRAAGAEEPKIDDVAGAGAGAVVWVAGFPRGLGAAIVGCGEPNDKRVGAAVIAT